MYSRVIQQVLCERYIAGCVGSASAAVAAAAAAAQVEQLSSWHRDEASSIRTSFSSRLGESPASGTHDDDDDGDDDDDDDDVTIGANVPPMAPIMPPPIMPPPMGAFSTPTLPPIWLPAMQALSELGNTCSA